MLDLMGTVTTAADEDDFFERRSGRLSKRLARVKSFRLFEGDRQIGCFKVNRVR